MFPRAGLSTTDRATRTWSGSSPSPGCASAAGSSDSSPVILLPREKSDSPSMLLSLCSPPSGNPASRKWCHGVSPL
ncbi:MAG: hypothetical protein ACK55Z_11225, partial [bacterium]